MRPKVMEKDAEARAKQRYEEDLIEIVKDIFKEHKIGGKNAASIVQDKIMPAEVKAVEKRKETWSNLKVNRRTQEAVKKFILKKYCR